MNVINLFSKELPDSSNIITVQYYDPDIVISILHFYSCFIIYIVVVL